MAKSQYDIATMDLEQQRLRGQINDAQYARGLANENAFLEYRTEMAKNPISKVCKSEMRVVGNTQLYPIPKSCENGFDFPIWPDGPRKSLKVEWVTTGGRVLVGSPELFAGRGSTATTLGNNLWEVEGNVYYRHVHADEDIELRITVQ